MLRSWTINFGTGFLPSVMVATLGVDPPPQEEHTVAIYVVLLYCTLFASCSSYRVSYWCSQLSLLLLRPLPAVSCGPLSLSCSVRGISLLDHIPGMLDMGARTGWVAWRRKKEGLLDSVLCFVLDLANLAEIGNPQCEILET